MFEIPLAEIQSSASRFQENVLDDFGLTIIEKIYDPFTNNLYELFQMEQDVHEELLQIKNILDEARSIT